MSSRTTIARSLHDVGAAAWFGGSLMGAVGVNGTILVLVAPQGEQQRPSQILTGLGGTLARRVGN